MKHNWMVRLWRVVRHILLILVKHDDEHNQTG